MTGLPVVLNASQSLTKPAQESSEKSDVFDDRVTLSEDAVIPSGTRLVGARQESIGGYGGIQVHRRVSKLDENILPLDAVALRNGAKSFVVSKGHILRTR